MIDLKGKKIFVVTNVEAGWDCVNGVYLAESEEALIEYLGDYNEETDAIHERSLEVVTTKAENRDDKINTILE